VASGPGREPARPWAPEPPRLLDTDPDRLVAFRHPAVPETAGFPRWRPDEHEVDRWCRLLAESGIPADPWRLHLDPAGLPPSPIPGAVIVHPGARSEERRWPAERWSAPARLARRAARVLVTAGPGELELASRVATGAGLGPDSVWTGSLLRLAGLVAGAGCVLSGDTGVAHLATALRRPSVVLFGPVAPAVSGPPPLPRHRVLWAGPRGLLEIGPADVIGALRGRPA
jgi:ADP-heptose:LPS heptosyltransferase